MMMIRCTTIHVFLTLCLGGVAPADEASHTISVFAGTGEKSYAGDGEAAVSARLNNPFGLVRGPDGALYICDTGNHVVRKVSPSGVIATVAGTGKAGYQGDGGKATEAKLNEPYEVRFDTSGDLYFVEMQNHVVRKVDSATGTISTVAGTGALGFDGDGGLAINAKLYRPHSIQFAPSGDLFICDIGNHRLRAVDRKTGMIRTVSGTGEKKTSPDGSRFAEASLNGPRAIDFDANGDLWLALREGNAVYRFDMKAGKLHHIAGTGKKGFTGNGGPAKEATLSGPKGVSIAPDGNVYLADTESHSVRMIDLAIKPPALRLIAGTGTKGSGSEGEALKSTMARLHGIFVDKDGAIYIGDSENHRVWVIRKR
jgi:streptogramin lyase